MAARWRLLSVDCVIFDRPGGGAAVWSQSIFCTTVEGGVTHK